MKNNRLGRIVTLPTFPDHRGSLSVAEESKELPFAVRRVYWVYGVPPDVSRGGHAHFRQQQLITAVAGSFSVTLDNGSEKETFLLHTPSQGLLVPAGIWNTLENFSADAVCMVAASDTFDESDYIRDYNDFLNYRLNADLPEP